VFTSASSDRYLADPTPPGIFLARPESVGDGKRLAVKDLFDTAGLTTTYGSIVYADHVPNRTAEAVARLEAAGYVDVGKTNLHEFAYGITSVNPHFGTVPNPAFPGRIAGGSSGGSAAALAAGLAEYALGTDSGGSIRIPAACCGIVGFKPTYGLVSVEGVFPLAPSFDHVGPMARTVAACAEMLEVLAEAFVPTRLEALDELEVGVAWLDRADPLVHARVREATELFPRRREIDFPLAEETGPVFMREVADVHRDLFAEFADSYGENVRTKVERCLEVSDAEYERGVRAREQLRDRAQSATEGLDLVLTPTLGFVAPRLPADDLEIRGDVIRLTYPFNALGWPTLALPCGPAEDGLPASLQIAGPPGADAQVLAAGELLEEALRPSGS
jgi:aspartyl-tRNA(Asn)/glutamyl-tRNA(Gln) amidotransferase subunit A